MCIVLDGNIMLQLGVKIYSFGFVLGARKGILLHS